MSEEFKFADSPMDFEWFRKVLDKSQKVLDNTPQNSQPSWYRTYIKYEEE